MTHCILIGAPVDAGQRVPGCMMGPAAYRVAGLGKVLESLGHSVEDRGDVALPPLGNETHPNAAIHDLPEMIGWTKALRDAAETAMPDGMPISTERETATRPSSAETGKPSAMISFTLRDSYLNEGPRSPRNRLAQESTYCLGNGSFNR